MSAEVCPEHTSYVLGCPACDTAVILDGGRSADQTASGTMPERQDGGTPTERKRDDGQYVDHWVLSADDRAKGFIRPVRKSYTHVGAPGPRHPLTELSDEQKALWPDEGFVKFEPYPESERPSLGRFWTQKDLDGIGRGCRGTTSMGLSIAETYASRPGFYGSTFCATCGDYFKVGRDGEFVWAGTDERVGT